MPPYNIPEVPKSTRSHDSGGNCERILFLPLAARIGSLCTFVKDVRTLAEEHDPDFIKILQQIRVITTLMNDGTSHVEDKAA
jgi:hypothetical protein